MEAVRGIIAGRGCGVVSGVTEPRRLPLWAGWLLALAVAAVCASLGSWQLQRMHAKQALLDASARVLEAREPRPLALAADPARARDFDWAAGAGRFADLPPVLLDNQNRDSRPGVRAYRVFQPADAKAPPLLVELGWLPLPGDRRLPVVELPVATRVSGLLLPPPSAGLAAPATSGATALQQLGQGQRAIDLNSFMTALEQLAKD